MEERLKKIEKNLEELKKLFDVKIIKKAQRLDEVLEYLNQIDITPVCTQDINSSNGEPFLKIEYHLEPTIIKFDDEGEIEYGEQFRYLNLLDLLSYESQEEIIKQIEILKKVKKRLDN